MKQLLLDITEPDPPTLENFIPGDNAELLYTLKNLIADRLKDRFFYLWGAAGSGKSHLLQAITNAFAERRLKVTYIDCNQASKFSFDAANMDCVSVDNVDQLDDPAQIKLFNLYNCIHENDHGIFLASGPKPPALLNLRQDLATRLGWGLVYQVHELTDDKKIEVMKNHAARQGFELPQEICDYLLRHEQRDLPSLIRLIDALDRFSLIRKRPITLPLLRELLQASST
jgi:DnaA-homolog protein